MKRRVLSLIIMLALCLNLCPVWVLAAGEGTGGGLCPHHPAHTDGCGYVPPTAGQECAHTHDSSCYAAETDCTHRHTAECYPDSDGDSEGSGPVLCTHVCTEDSGCVVQTLSCPHEHDGTCGYVPEDPGAACTFVCRICPIEDLIAKLPSSVSAGSSEQIEAQLSEIYALYDGLTPDEQEQIDLSPCISLLDQMEGMGAEVLSDGSDDDPVRTLDSDLTLSEPYVISKRCILNTAGYTLFGTVQVTGTGVLDLRGNVVSKTGAGVEVQPGGSLRITEPDTVVKGLECALNIASGADVQLSAGTYSIWKGSSPALQVEDNNFAALLADGCAYFDAGGSLILPADVATATTVTIGLCTDHSGKVCTHTAGTPTHTWACPYCGTGEEEPCTFTFDADGNGTCAPCGNTLTIDVDETDLTNLVYDGTIKPEDVNITVTLTDSSNQELIKGTDYKVEYVPRTDAGEITVTVTGRTFRGTFTKTYQVSQDRPVLEWDTTVRPVPAEVDYDGEAVEKEIDLPPVKINIQSDKDDLQGDLQYSYKKTGDSAYTDGLPKDAGTYDVIVSLPEMPNFEAAESAPIKLTIRKISPIVTAPAATQPVFNRTAQALVTPGVLCDVAIRDGIVIEFAESETGGYSTAIPTGINAGDYEVWYKVEGTDNYNAVGPAPVNDVKIQRKPITPDVTLSYYTCVFDNGDKEPAVTVKDEDQVTELLRSEYRVEYQNNRNVGTAKVVVTDEPGGNYEITPAEVEFQITAKVQDGLSITGQRDVVTYGDQFTLGTTGGSGNGVVTWEITEGKDTVAAVDPKSGQVTVIGHGEATVKATKSGAEPVTRAADGANYEDATASWTFTVVKKPVTATVTAEDKTYNEYPGAKVHAVVERSGLVAGDEITITLPDGTFEDENAGVDKIVTVVTTGAQVGGTNWEHYDISYSSDTTPVKATIHKATAKITTVTAATGLTYDGTEKTLITGAVADPGSVQAEYALSEDGEYSTDSPKGTDAGTYTVWYRVKETDNYIGEAPQSVSVTVAKKQVAPVIALDQDSFVYDGTAKEPVVTLTADGSTIPAGEYTVAYSGNVNVGPAAVTVTAKAGGNYTFTNAPVTKNFTITEEAAKVTEKPEAAGDPLVFNNRAQKLVTAGAGTGGTMVYSLWENDPAHPYEETIPTGFNAGEYTVFYKVAGDGNHSDSQVDSVAVTISPKTVKDPPIELYDEHGNSPVSFTYDGTAKTPTKVVVKDGSTVIDEGEYTVHYSDNINAGKAAVSIADNLNGNYTVTGSAAFDIFKADIVFNPAPAAANLTYNGKAQELIEPGTMNGGTVLYALGSPNSRYTDAIPRETNAGDYTVYYKAVGDKNHNDFAVQSVPVTIKRKPLTAITIELTPPGFEFDGTVKLPEVTVKDGETVLPETEYEWTCTPSANPTDEGTYTITITDKPGGNYDLTGVTANTMDFTIGKTAQEELVIGGKPSVTNYRDSFQLTVSGGSGNGAVIWQAAGPATVDAAGNVTITGVGEVTITVDKAADTNYNSAQAHLTFTAAPRPVTASVVVADKTYDGTTDADVASASVTALAGDTVTIDPDSITAAFDTPAVGEGKTVTLDAGNVRVTGVNADKYDISYPAAVKAAVKAKQVAALTVELSDIDLKTDPDGSYYYEYDGAVKTPAVTLKDDDGKVIPSGEYTFSYSNNRDASDTTATPPVLASVTVKAKDGGNYGFADKTVSFTIRKTGAQLTASPEARVLTYTGQPQELVTVGAAAGGHLEYAVGNDAYGKSIPKKTDAGTYTVYYKVVGDGNHTDSTEVGSVSVTIHPKEIVSPEIALEQTTYEYDGAPKTPGVTVTAKDVTGPIDPSEYSVSYRDNVNAGTAAVIVSDKAGNYIVNGTATFQITEKAPTVVTPPEGKTGLQYNGQLQELLEVAGDADGGTLVYSLNGGDYSPAIPTASAVGKYAITYKVLGAANYSDTSPVPLAEVEIAKNTVTSPNIQVTPNEVQYNGGQQRPTVTVRDDKGRLIPEQEYKVTFTGTKGDNLVDVDTYTVTVTTPADSNYVINSNNTRTFTIVPADQETISITGTKAQVYYGDTIQLGATGGTGGSTITWEIAGHTDTTLTQGGLLTVKDVGGPITVTVKRTKDNYSEVSAAWEFSAEPKPVTAVLTGVDRDFNGGVDATVKAEVPAGSLVFGDTFTIPDLTGTFDTKNVGTNKTITITGSEPVLTDPKAANYAITYPRTATASIRAVPAAVKDNAVAPVTPLIYEAGPARELVTVAADAVTGGFMVYSLDGGAYTTAIPRAGDAGTYTVQYKAQGDQNHTDSEAKSVTVTIARQPVTLQDDQIELTPSSAKYDGTEKRPQVTIRDGAHNVIPAGEYEVVYDPGTNWKDVGNHKVTVKNLTGGNYDITEANKPFTISTTAQSELVIDGPDRVYYGDTFTLRATGGSSSEKVEWNVPDAYQSIAAVDSNGFVTIKGTGPAEITAKKQGGANYDDATAVYLFNAQKKPVTAAITAEDRAYVAGDTSATLHVTWKDGALVGNDEIKIETLTGAFEDEKVGTNKKVTITCTFVDDATAQKYDIKLASTTTTASIFKADKTAPALAKNEREYDGTTQALVTGGNAGTTLYSDSRDGVYSAAVPQEKNAGTYTVWYKEKGDDNYNDSEPQGITVTIRRKPLTVSAANTTLSGSGLKTDGGTYYYDYDGAGKEPAVTITDGAAVLPAGEYTVRYSDNIEVGTNATVTITDNAGGNYEVSGAITFEIRKSGAQLVLPPQKNDLTYTGQPQALVTAGSAVGGHLEYAVGDTVTDGDYGTAIPTETGAGTYTVHYRVIADGSHNADSTTSGSVSVTIQQKTVVSPKVTVSGTYTYAGGAAQEPGSADVKVEDGGTVIPDTEYSLSYRDNINAGTATVIVTNASGGNYIVNGTGTFEIGKLAPTVTPPERKTGLQYNGQPQELLVQAGTADGGTLVYSLNGGDYSPGIPTASAVGEYTITYKVLGDTNHSDVAPVSLTDKVEIAKNTVTTPDIKVEPAQVNYNGEGQQPTVTVRDDAGLVIDGSEYTVSYVDVGGKSVDVPTDVGTYTLTIASTGNNYNFPNAATAATFEIAPADQPLLTIINKREQVHYGDTIQLDTEGGSGTVAWSVTDGSGSPISGAITPNGLLTVNVVGSVTVKAVSSAPGYKEQTAVWSFYAEKKPVTAVVTAADRAYTGDTTATLTVTISGLVSGEDVTGITATGHFADKNVGTNKTVIVDSITFPDNIKEKYDIPPVTTTTAEIFKAAVDETKVAAPAAVDGLEYTGLPQELVTAGSSPDGVMEYSTDNITYSTSLPTGTAAGDYTVWYRVKGDGNHNDMAAKPLAGKVTIARQAVSADELEIEFNPTGASYDGKEHKPAVTVKDKHGRVIPNSEYDVSYGTTDWTKAGAHEVTVTDKDVDGGNYTISEAKETFTILVAGQSPLSITNKPGRVQYGDSFTLSATGGSGNGKLVWSITDNGVAEIDQNGLVKVLKSGSAKVTVKREADGGYGEISDTWTFSAEKKPVTPIITARDREYDPGRTDAQLVITWNPGDLLSGDANTITLNLTGRFDDANVGTNKTVTVTGTLPSDDRYDIKLPPFPTASITPKAASVSGATNPTLIYSGSEQELVTNVTAVNGTLAYSLDGSYYTQAVPTKKNAGTYPVWYKAQASGNYKDSPEVRVNVTIEPKEVTNPVIELSPATFTYDGNEKKPGVVVKDGTVVIPAGEYTVSYSNNIQAGTNATVTIIDNDGGNYTVSGHTTFTIQAGTASLIERPEPNNRVYDGFEQPLVTRGTAVNGRVVYSEQRDSGYGPSIPVKIDAGRYQVWYKVEGSNGAADTEPDSVIVTIKPQPVSPRILLENEYSYSTPYTGSAIKPAVTVIVDGQTLSLGRDYSVSYNKNQKVGTAEVIVQSIGGNYEFIAVATFEITKGKATFFKKPEAVDNLVYTGEPQALVTKGFPEYPDDGIVVYSLDAGPYSSAIPTATKKGSYMVLAKVQGNAEYEDSDVVRCLVEIGINEVEDPLVELSSTSFNYTGSVQKPTITVSDGDGNVIPAGEYKVTYTGDTVNPGRYTLTITSRGINYSFDPIEREITILPAGQTPLTITGKQDTVYYGDTLRLGTEGGSGDGAVTWTASGPVDVLGAGQYKINSSGNVKITATKADSGSYGETTAVWEFYANPKPITAVVTAADKTYNGNNIAALTVTISSGLVGSDAISTNVEGGVTAAGTFPDANVGANKTVTIRLNVPESVRAKYDITCPDTTTASITPAEAEVTTPPAAIPNLKYNGRAQNLVSGGAADGGTIQYSVDGGKTYSLDVPTGTDAKTYSVWYKAAANDGNHTDSVPKQVENVAIAVNTDTPSVLCTPNTFQYNGKEQTPTVVVRDGDGNILSESEYTVTLPTPRIAVGKYTVTVTDNTGGNYEFASPVTVTDAFEITASGQSPLSITDKPGSVCYGDTFYLSAVGGSGGGAIQWSIAESSVATVSDSGEVTVTGTGGFTVKAYRKGADGYSDSNTDSAAFTAKPKPVTPVVTAKDKPYDGKTDAELSASLEGALVDDDTIALTVAGEFETADAGTNKRVTITSKTPSGVYGNYVISWPDSAAASIYRVDAKPDPDNRPAAADLTYTGTAQPLLASGGKTIGEIGVMEYSLSQSGGYSDAIPTATNAGRYEVWYRVDNSVNYMGFTAGPVVVEIKKADPQITGYPTASGTAEQTLNQIRLEGGATNTSGGTFAWKDGSITPVNGAEYDVIFTPYDTANYNTYTFKVAVTVTSNTPDTPSSDTDSTSNSGSAAASAQPKVTVQNGAASAALSAAAGDRLVREAAANRSPSIVIKPEITGDVTKAEVSIPVSTVKQIRNETDAALTVSTPIADTTIPQAALDTLGRRSGAVNVAAEQVDQAVVLTLTAGGETVENVPGGVTLSVPAEDAGPGTVAVLVHEDGTRETIRKSTVEDGKVNIPLNGSATVEIVDNSKDFTDVPPTSWAADAVAFASARELFSGTSETTFSPDQGMSRGMLVTVLYNLEGRPEQDLTMQDLENGYSDVSGGAWYAEGIAWAAENGIVSGYGDGQFGPNDGVTREQFAVILWKYAGGPAAKNRVLDFTDADQVSGYAQEALYWAVENGILSGYTNGQFVPGGMTTRAQAAQMLKNFMEHT